MMKRNLKKAVCFIAGSMLAVFMLTGCGGSSDQPASADTKAAETAAPTEAVETQPAETKAESQAPETDAETQAAGEKMVVGFANTNDVYPYLVKVRSFVQQFGEEAGFEVLVADAAGDINTQIGQIETWITNGIDIVISVPADPEGIVPMVDTLWNEGIPFLTVCGNSNAADEHEIHVGSLNYEAGQMQAEYLAETLPEGATVLYMHADPNQEQQDRRDGFMTLFEKRPDLELLAEQNSQNRQDMGMTIADGWIQKYEQFDAIVCQNDDSALGAIEALKAAKRLEGVTVVGLDGSEEALASIKAGEMRATAFQDAEGQAKALIEICTQIRDGADPLTMEDVSIPFKVITKETVDDVM